MTTPADEPPQTEPENTDPSASKPSSSVPRPVADDPPPVAQQREELAETVGALAKKLDAPARVSAAADQTVHTAAAKAKDNKVFVGAVVAGVLAVGALLVIRRRNR